MKKAVVFTTLYALNWFYLYTQMPIPFDTFSCHEATMKVILVFFITSTFLLPPLSQGEQKSFFLRGIAVQCH